MSARSLFLCIASSLPDCVLPSPPMLKTGRSSAGRVPPVLPMVRVCVGEVLPTETLPELSAAGSAVRAGEEAAAPGVERRPAGVHSHDHV